MQTFQGGRCLVANSVIDQMIAHAAAEVKGVLEVRGYDASKGALRLGHERYIVTETENGTLDTSLVLRVAPEESITEVVVAVQEAVKQEVETMLGLYCRRVDLVVA